MHQNVPNLFLMIFIAHNDIHGSLEEGYSPGRVRTRPRAQIDFSHTSYSLQISALTRTLNPLNPKFFSLQTTFSPHMPFTHLISISVQAIGCHTPAQRPSSLSGQKPALCKVRVVFSKPVHAVRAWGGPPGTNHGLFKAKPSSHHVHSTLPVTPPTSPCPTLSADAEPARKRAETIFSTQCAV